MVNIPTLLLDCFIKSSHEASESLFLRSLRDPRTLSASTSSINLWFTAERFSITLHTGIKLSKCCSERAPRKVVSFSLRSKDESPGPPLNGPRSADIVLNSFDAVLSEIAGTVDPKTSRICMRSLSELLLLKSRYGINRSTRLSSSELRILDGAWLFETSQTRPRMDNSRLHVAVVPNVFSRISKCFKSSGM